MKISFSCLGFSTATIFVNHPTGDWCIGSRRECPDEIWIDNGIWRRYIKEEDLPSKEEIEAEYQRQYAEKGVWINKGIVYAG